MPWKTCEGVDARQRFIRDWLERTYDGDFSHLCRWHGIGRVCGYKWVRRFRQGGDRALREQSRRPRRADRMHARWIERVRTALVQERDFGPKKLYWKLARDYPREHVPCTRTLSRWLAKLGKVQRRARRAACGPRIRPAGRLRGRCANDVWSIDLKGSFRTRDGRLVVALTVRDLASRYVLGVQHVRRADEKTIGRILRKLFRRYGLPRALRMDNGAPFGATGPRGWSRLSVQWIKLGIRTEYGRPRHPQDNAEHEQMHRILKRATAQPASVNLRAQQRRFDRWRKRYNERRPHEALGMRTPASRYRRSPRVWSLTDGWSYPQGWATFTPDAKGRVFWQKRQRLIGKAFISEPLGLKPMRSGIFSIYFREHLIGTLHANDFAGMRSVQWRRLHSY